MFLSSADSAPKNQMGVEADRLDEKKNINQQRRR
jgi:hypothetical protein